MEIYTLIHVVISLLAITSGFGVLFGLITGMRLDVWTAFFLATTVLTSATGFGFPISGVTPGIVLGVISLVVLAVAIYARYAPSRRHLAANVCHNRGDRTLSQLPGVDCAIISESAGAQSVAPTQSEPPFLIAQLVALAAFIGLGYLATTRFREKSTSVV